ncbi:MAG: phospholipid carrier-dependent glycosyltransferase [Elainella sp.]
MKAASRHWLYSLSLLLLTALGLGIRLLNLAEKPLWTDEFSTIVFSLGNSFLSVPLDQPISTEVLLEPLRPQGAGPEAVVANLFRESNHPPLYFLLSHFWLQLFPILPSGWVSAWAVRLLPAILGALSIPLTFQLGWLAFRSRAAAQVAAAVMAVSPFGIYLAQEARHYTLPLIWILLSLCCFVVAARHLRERQVVPISICLGWIVVNGLGIATHYFFVFTLGAEAIVLLCLGLVQSWQERGIWYPSAHWRRIWIVAAGTAAAGLIWWPVLQNIQGGELTRWIYEGNRSGLAWLEPIGQAVAGWVTMLYLLPIQADSQGVVVLSGVILVLLVLWTFPKLDRGLKVQLLQRDSRLGVMVLGAFVVSAILLFFSITYLFETDLTGAFRYNFVYFPGAVVLLGAGLASSWNVALWIAHSPAGKVSPVLLSLLRVSSRRVVLLVWLLSLLGALTVVTNLGYQKTHRPDVVAAAIQSQSQPGATVLVAIPHQTHGQTGRLMGVALALRQMANQTPNPLEPLFLLAHDTQNPRSVMATLRRTLNQLPRPLDLWLLNFQTVPNSLVEELLEQQNCEAEGKSRSVDGYRYRHYRCTEPLARPTRRPSSE